MIINFHTTLPAATFFLRLQVQERRQSKESVLLTTTWEEVHTFSSASSLPVPSSHQLFAIENQLLKPNAVIHHKSQTLFFLESCPPSAILSPPPLSLGFFFSHSLKIQSSLVISQTYPTTTAFADISNTHEALIDCKYPLTLKKVVTFSALFCFSFFLTLQHYSNHQSQLPRAELGHNYPCLHMFLSLSIGNEPTLCQEGGT